MSELFKAAFITEDGKVFSSKQEALDYVRLPKIRAAMTEVAKDPELVEWLITNQEEVVNAFDTGTIKRVTKSERTKLEKALNSLEDNKDAAFIYENRAAILESFRWPTVKRLKEEEKLAEVKAVLSGIAGDNPELPNWIIENKDAIMSAYDAGVEKRTVSDKAKEALAAYRAKKAAEKAAAGE